MGDRVEPDQVLAKLDPQDELNTLRSAQAVLTAAQGQLIEASNNFDRQKQLLEHGFTTKVLFDQAQQGLRTAQSRVDRASPITSRRRPRELHAAQGERDRINHRARSPRPAKWCNPDR